MRIFGLNWEAVQDVRDQFEVTLGDSPNLAWAMDTKCQSLAPFIEKSAIIASGTAEV